MEQTILSAEDNYSQLDQYWRESGSKRLFLVCGPSINKLPIGHYFETLPERLDLSVIRFSDFQPNPNYASVAAGIHLFQEKDCDTIVAVGGGSAIDVGKCIKLWCQLEPKKNYLTQPIVPNSIKLLAIPTTAGSGSEATRFAVIYSGGKKQSISDHSCIPSAVLFDPSVLASLPLYHKKSAMLDALCHGIESYWSIHSTAESKAYSRKTLRLIMTRYSQYLYGDRCAGSMLEAAHLAGKAINITQTTAGHAMCYQLTTRFGIAHGHAAALCVSVLWPYMLEHTADCVDPRGPDYLEQVFQEIADAMGCASPSQAAMKFQSLIQTLNLGNLSISEADLNQFTESVAPERLCNHPVYLGPAVIKELYQKIAHFS